MSNSVIREPRNLPILFTTAMVVAILEGRKTQTRRMVRPQPSQVLYEPSLNGKGLFEFCGDCDPKDVAKTEWKAPYMPGDRLWVRETFQSFGDGDRYYAADWPPLFSKHRPVHADDDPADWKWKSPYHMHQNESRIWLEVLDTRLVVLQDISEEDAKAEGVPTSISYISVFKSLWESINAKRGFGWDAEFKWWVWAYTFKRGKPL